MPYEPQSHLNSNLFSTARNIYSTRGLGYLIRRSFWHFIDLFFSSIYYNLFRASETFQFQGKQYHYVFHKYCTTWRNERCAIIPIARNIVVDYQNQGKAILEVGNVLSYIYPVFHDVIDKYENVKNVIKDDIVEFKTSKQYDLIFSLVTMQHIGHNESQSDPKKVLKAMENLKNMLAPNGQIVIIHALGENKEMDELIKNGSLRFSSRFYLKKVSGYKWKQTGWSSAKDLPYDYQTPSARAVLVGIYNNN